MENYLLVLYVTIGQEDAIKDLFKQRGWFFHKTDIKSLERNRTTDELISSSKLLQSNQETQSNVKERLLTAYQQESSLFYSGLGETNGFKSFPTKGYSQNQSADITDGYLPNLNTNSSVEINHEMGRKRQDWNSDTLLDHFQGLCDKTIINKDDKTFDSNGNSVDMKKYDDERGKSVTHQWSSQGKGSQLNCDTNDCQLTQVDGFRLGETALRNYEQNESYDNHEEHSLSGGSDVFKNGERTCIDSKSDLKLKIERGKNAFLEKRRKRQEHQSNTKIGIKSNSNGVKSLNSLNIQTSHKNKKQAIHCKDCDQTFTSIKRFESHKARNGGQCVFPCEYCDKVFKYRKSKYLLHVRSAHTKERPHVCQVCGKGYVTSDKLKIHLRMHTGEKPCICEQCGKSFYSRAELSIHKEYHHLSRENQDEMRCDVCHVTFCSKRYLAYHKNITHSEQRDFLCNKCEKRFKCNSALQRHLKYMHTESRDFVCEICDKSFKTPACLRKHNVRHGGDRNYLCSYCDKAFYEKTKLLQHERIHTGEKPYKCDICDYRCALSGNLSKHKKIHYRE